MELSKIFAKIKELGQANNKKNELIEYCKLKIEQILKFLPERILRSDGADLLNCILNGLPDNEAGTSKCKIIELVLKVMKKESTSLTHTGDIISRLCLDLSRLPSQDLIRLSSDSIQSIVEDKDVNMIWKDVLPECLNGLSSHNQVKHCGTDLTPAEFKEQCVRTLCQCRWKEGQLIQLAAMFKEMQLSREDHRQVVNKLCSYILDVPPETLPPFVHQLVKLCKSHNVEIVLFNLAHYFNARLYDKMQPTLPDSETTTIDLNELVPYSSEELSRCLSTCIYHITHGAAEPETIRKHLRLWPKPQLLRSPFLLELALALSDKGADFRSVCIDIVKSAIEQRVIDSLKAKESAWIRSVLPAEVEVASVLKILTAGSGNELDLTVVGLINLAFALLATPRTKPTSAICQSYGKLILVRLCKSRSEVASHIMSQLADRLAGDSATHRQYADCLYVLCKLTPQCIERCSSLTAILENCQPHGMDYKAAAASFDAVHPLLQFSTRVRDSMVMVCRKGLYSRDSVHRCLALSGFLSLLRHVKLPRVGGSSQSACSEQFSAHSYLTQLCVDLHATQHGAVTSRVRNEAMCMEVVSILRRCLVQDAAVKQLLYSSIYLCAKEKSVLHEPILELLHEHLSRYVPETEEGPLLLFDKCVHSTTISAVLTEPIGHLLFATAQFLQPIHDEELEDILGSQGGDGGSVYLKSQLQVILGKLVAADRLATVHMEDPGLADLTLESKAKSLKVQQILQCYEALIAHLVMSWNTSDKKIASTTYNLFKAYNELLDKTKAPPKISKKSQKNTQNDTRDAGATQKSQQSQKDKGKKRPQKFSNMVKDKAGPFRPLPCLWDLPFCLRITQLLYGEEVPWSSLEQRNHLRSKRDFHHFTSRCVQSVLNSECLDKRTVATYVPKLAALLFARCLSRYQEMCDFDDTTTQYCIDVFKDCLTVLLSPNYGFKIDTFLPTVAGLTESPPSTCIAAILEKIHSSLSHLESESDEEARDAIGRKLATSLMQTASILLGIPAGECARMTNTMAKLEEYVRRSKHDCLHLTSALLDATCRLNQDQYGRLLDQLIDKLTAALGRIDEEDSSVGAESTEFPSIDERSGQTALASTCVHVTARIGHVQVLLARAHVTGNTALLYGDGERAEQKKLYKSLVTQLCQLCMWVSKLCKLRCSVGTGSEKVLASCIKFYVALAALFKNMDINLLQDIRLERLLKLSGKKLSTTTDNLITYLEASQPQQQAAHKVMRDMKMIPRLVLEAEQYTKHVLLVSNKAKVNFGQYLSLGTARDFRIKAPVLQQVLNAEPDDTRNETVEIADDINDADTTLLSAQSDGDNKGGGKKKKRRLS